MAHFSEKNLEMSEAEMGKIALAYVRAKNARGVRVHSQLIKDIGEIAKECGIALGRAKVFSEIMVREVVDEVFK